MSLIYPEHLIFFINTFKKNIMKKIKKFVFTKSVELNKIEKKSIIGGKNGTELPPPIIAEIGVMTVDDSVGPTLD